MGGNFSSRQDVYINRFNNPKVQEMQKTISVRGVVGERHLIFENCKNFDNPFKGLVSTVDEGHSAVITGIYLLFVRNEIDKDLIVTVNGLFNGKKRNQDVSHVDDTGNLRILCPAKYNNTVTGIDGILYKPRLKHEILQAYVGMEDAIVAETNQVIYENTHPIVHFILNHMDNPPIDHREGFFHFEKEYIDRVKLFFKNTIYDDIHKTRFEDVKIMCEVENSEQLKKSIFQQSLTFIIQINYLMIMPGESKMKIQELKR